MFLTGLPRERVKSNITMGNHKDILIKKIYFTAYVLGVLRTKILSRGAY